MVMLKSEQLWDSLSYPLDKNDWVSFFNKFGINGELLETEDTVSFISPSKNKAVKLTHSVGNQHSVFGWLSEFGDEASGVVDVLNIYFSDPNQDLACVNQLVERWSNGQTSNEEMSSIMEALLVTDTSNHIQFSLPWKHTHFLLHAVNYRLETWEQMLNSGELNEDEIAEINNDFMLLKGVQKELQEKLAEYDSQIIHEVKD